MSRHTGWLLEPSFYTCCSQLDTEATDSTPDPGRGVRSRVWPGCLFPQITPCDRGPVSPTYACELVPLPRSPAADIYRDPELQFPSSSVPSFAAPSAILVPPKVLKHAFELGYWIISVIYLFKISFLSFPGFRSRRRGSPHVLNLPLWNHNQRAKWARTCVHWEMETSWSTGFSEDAFTYGWPQEYASWPNIPTQHKPLRTQVELQWNLETENMFLLPRQNKGLK